MLKLGIFVADEDNLRVLKKNVAIVTRLYVTMPLVFVGFVCNLLIVVVLGRDKSMNKTTKFLLQILALADIIYYVFRQIADIVEEQLLNSSSLRSTVYTLEQASQLITSWMAVTVTYQRYVAVSRPLHARQCITTSRTRVAVVVVWIGSFIIIPLLNYGYYHEFVHFYLYKIIFLCTVLLLPISLTVFLNIRLIVVVRRSRTFVGQQLSSGGNNDSRNASSNRVTVTLVVILIVYLLCQLPMATVQVLFVIHEWSCLFWYDVIAWELCSCLIVVNSLADCVTYCIMGKRFRQILFRELLCRRNYSK
jgi:hypothetical protein